MKRVQREGVPCVSCGKTVWRTQRTMGLYRMAFCDRGCHREYQVRMGLKNGTSLWKRCRICGKEFVVSVSQDARFVTCGSRRCYLTAKSKENNGNWKGGVTRKRKAVLTTARYRIWRRNVFERDDFTCCGCGRRGGALCADHIKSWAYYPDLRYEVANGRTLCVRCHKATYYYNLVRKLSDQDAVDIVERSRSGEDVEILAKEFKVAVCTVYRITKCERYQHATSHLFGKYFPRTAEEKLLQIREEVGS